MDNLNISTQFQDAHLADSTPRNNKPQRPDCADSAEILSRAKPFLDYLLLINGGNLRSEYRFRCLKAGAQGYLNKAGDPADLITAVRTVAQGRKYVTAGVAQMLVDNLSAPESSTASRVSPRPVVCVGYAPSAAHLSPAAAAPPESPRRRPRPRAAAARCSRRR